MIGHADYCTILGKDEITPSVQAYLDILKPCAPGIEMLEGGGVRINNASQQDQDHCMRIIEARWEIDRKADPNYDPDEEDV